MVARGGGGGERRGSADDEPALGGDAAVHYRDFFPHDIPPKDVEGKGRGLISNDPGFLGGE